MPTDPGVSPAAAALVGGDERGSERHLELHPAIEHLGWLRLAERVDG
jgi:hypothetical protein